MCKYCRPNVYYVIILLIYIHVYIYIRVIAREGDLEKLNKEALRIARAVADKTGTLMAGNISNIASMTVGDPASEQAVKAMFKVG